MKQRISLMLMMLTWPVLAAEDFQKPYTAPCVERENVFAFTEKPAVKNVGPDTYEITFAVKGNCDVTVGIVDPGSATNSPSAGQVGVVVRHLGSGVLGANVPAPFQKNSLSQKIRWDGKDDLGEYVKDASKMKVRVMLGLKPEFDKRLGITNPKSIPGGPWGIVSDETGVYLFFCGYGSGINLRKFDHDGNYVKTLLPLPANLPEDKLQGLGYIEYEPGKKALHKPDLSSTWNNEPGGLLPHGLNLTESCYPAIVGGRIYYCTAPAPEGRGPSLLHSVRTEGSVEAQGVQGKAFMGAGIGHPCLAASPDGKWLYVAGDLNSRWGAGGGNAVYRYLLDNDKLGEKFLGEQGKPGSDNNHFNFVSAVDCDSQGRIYVSDQDNNRIQVFTADGKYAKTIPLDRPGRINVHRKTGSIYVNHTARVQGASVNRISKLTSYDNPVVEFFLDCTGGRMTLDSWTAKPRIWLFGDTTADGRGFMNVRILEEDNKQFRKIADFEEEVKAELAKTGMKSPGGWSGSSYASGGKAVCDPTREQAIFGNASKFDLRTGEWLGPVRLPFDDIAFDKYGYLHGHFNPSYIPGVMRLRENGQECPYDYGVEVPGHGKLGILPCRDQLGAKFFQDGIGVNMRGDVAEQCNIYYAPKLEDESKAFQMVGNNARMASGTANDGDGNNFAASQAEVQRKLKAGEEVYSIKRKPGRPLTGATIWTFNRNGELKDESAVVAGGLMNGVMIDEDGGLYFVTDRIRQFNDKPFLSGCGGFFGMGKDAKVRDPITQQMGRRQPEPFTGTLVKTGRKGEIISTYSPIPLDQRPTRSPDLHRETGAAPEKLWCEGAEWIYAGASPIVVDSCSCPTMRSHVDWYKRTFVPEAYRYSIGVLDTAGNLILHIGQYGNFDSGYGPSSKVPVGGDGIAFCDARMVSGTDNYLCFSDQGYRILVLKLNYHAEETVGIGNK